MKNVSTEFIALMAWMIAVATITVMFFQSGKPPFSGFGSFYEIAIDSQDELRPMIDAEYIENGYSYMAQYPHVPLGSGRLKGMNYSSPPRVMCPSRKIIYIDYNGNESTTRRRSLFALCAPE